MHFVIQYALIKSRVDPVAFIENAITVVKSKSKNRLYRNSYDQKRYLKEGFISNKKLITPPTVIKGGCFYSVAVVFHSGNQRLNLIPNQKTNNPILQYFKFFRRLSKFAGLLEFAYICKKSLLNLY